MTGVAGRPDWFTMFMAVECLTVLGIPLVVAATWWLAHRRRVAGVDRSWAWRSAVAELGIAYGTLPLIGLTLVPGDDAGSIVRRVSLVPFEDLATMSQIGVAGNLLLFSAAGFLAPVRWAALASVPRMVGVGALGSASVETLQYALRLDRVTSVDDVLLNATGAGLAALASAPWWRRAAAVPRAARA